MSPNFKAGAREGFRVCLPVSVGLIPWALVTGLAMVSAGFTPVQAMGMSFIVFGATAQLGTLPLIVIGADCPMLGPNLLHEADAALRAGADAVFCPADDGGYGLIGLARAQPGLGPAPAGRGGGWRGIAAHRSKPGSL